MVGSGKTGVWEAVGVNVTVSVGTDDGGGVAVAGGIGVTGPQDASKNRPNKMRNIFI